MSEKRDDGDWKVVLCLSRNMLENYRQAKKRVKSVICIFCHCHDDDYCCVANFLDHDGCPDFFAGAVESSSMWGSRVVYENKTNREMVRDYLVAKVKERIFLVKEVVFGLAGNADIVMCILRHFDIGAR